MRISTVKVKKRRSRSILEMSSANALAFLLKQESYCNVDLPPYFYFKALLSNINRVLKGKKLRSISSQKPSECERVNHIIFNNKDGRYAWRPLQLIHPALYVSLAQRITEKKHWKLICDRFAYFSKNKKIECLSLPIESLTAEKDKAEQITNWWLTIEQASIRAALDYEFVSHTDITDCYGAIYTHAIAWALHTKEEAKKNRKNTDLVGNIIDEHIRDMCHGQTNGIPQGSVLMDLIAEMVLGYADSEITEKIAKEEIEDYRILRFRDDYRIFANSSHDGERILKCITEVMIDLGLKMNPAKTKISSKVIRASLKEDKLSWICGRQFDENPQKHLLIIHEHSTQHPNSGSLTVALGDYLKRVSRFKKKNHFQPLPLISIVVDIAYCNPKAFPVCAAILSKLISFLKSEGEKKVIVEKIKKKFSKMPNTGYMQIWLQNVSFRFAPDIEFDEPLCQLIRGKKTLIWNNEWISSRDLKSAVDAKKAVNQTKLKKLDAIVPIEEVALFIAKADIAS